MKLSARKVRIPGILAGYFSLAPRSRALLVQLRDTIIMTTFTIPAVSVLVQQTISGTYTPILRLINPSAAIMQHDPLSTNEPFKANFLAHFSSKSFTVLPICTNLIFWIKILRLPFVNMAVSNFRDLFAMGAGVEPSFLIRRKNF